MKKSMFVSVAAVLLATGTMADEMTGDAEAGERYFTRLCAQCHSTAANQNRLGPSLHGVFGSEAGQVRNFRYSPVLLQSGIVWTVEALDEFIQHPQEVIPRSRMAFTGLSSPEQRADIIAFMATLTDE